MAITKGSMIKLVELILALAIYWMHYNTFEGDNHVHLFLMTSTFAGFLIVVIGTFLGLITGNTIPKSTDTFYCVCGAVLYITAGALSIQHFRAWTFSSSTSDWGIIKGSTAIVEGVIFLVDAFFVYKGF